MAFHFTSAYGNFFNDHAQLIGHEAIDVHAWLAAHPDYRGCIWANWNDGSEDFEVTEIFFPEEEEAEAEQVAA